MWASTSGKEIIRREMGKRHGMARVCDEKRNGNDSRVRFEMEGGREI